MKKIALLALSFSLMWASSLQASVTLSINKAGWGSDSADNVNGMTWGLIIASDGSGFGASAVTAISEALQDFVLPAIASPSNPVQIGTTVYYFARAQANTAIGPPPTFAEGLMNTVQLNLAGDVGAGDSAALAWFPGTTALGQAFGLFDLATVLPSDGSTISPASTAGRANLVIGVPEPSRAVLAGLGLFGMLFRRRR